MQQKGHYWPPPSLLPLSLFNKNPFSESTHWLHNESNPSSRCQEKKKKKKAGLAGGAAGNHGSKIKAIYSVESVWIQFHSAASEIFQSGPKLVDWLTRTIAIVSSLSMILVHLRWPKFKTTSVLHELAPVQCNVVSYRLETCGPAVAVHVTGAAAPIHF